MKHLLKSVRLTVHLSLILSTSLGAAGVTGKFILAGREYVQVGSEWYQDDNGRLFPVIDGVLTLRFLDGEQSQSHVKELVGAGLEITRVNRLGIYDVKFRGDIFQKSADLIETGLFQFVEVATRGEYIGFFPDDTHFDLQWGLHNTGQTGGVPDADVDAPEGWELEKGDPAVIIAVIDSGTEFYHEDLFDNMWKNLDEIPNNGIDDDNNGYVDDYDGWDFYNDNNDPSGTYYHGTHVAGIISARTNNGVGIAGLAGGDGAQRGSLIMPAAVGDSYPDAAVLDDAILYAADMGASVITMSLTVSQTTAIDLAVEYAYDNMGVFIDCAAGNDYGGPVGYPASLQRIMAVGASEDDDGVAYYSSCGPEVEVIAPGSDIYSTQLGDTYGTSDGTSFAAPHVAGIAALILSVDNSMINEEIRQLIIDTSEDIDEPGHGNCSGWGRINVNEALLEVGSDEIRGLVINGTTGNRMDSVLVEVLDPYKYDYTDEDGSYDMRSDFPDSVQIDATFIGYEVTAEWVEVVQEGVTYHNIQMNAINPGYLAGYVTDIDTGEGIGGTLGVYYQSLELTHTDVDGVTGYYILEVPEGTWVVTVDPVNPYMNISEPGVVITMGDTTYLDFELAALTVFSDVSAAAGILGGGFGEGVSFADYDGDGDEDIFVVNLFGDNRMYRNTGGTFDEVAASIGLAGEGRGFAGVWGDYDRDYDLDCFITQRSGYNALYRNDGGVFTDVTSAAGVGGEDWDYGQGAAWVDVNRDGRLDLYVANKSGSNRLFRNRGTTFVEVGSQYGVDDPGASWGVSVADYDSDGDADIYVVNAEQGNTLYRNDGLEFTDVSSAAGVADLGTGRGSSWGDVDGDGDMDLYVTNVGADVMYRNDGGVFTDVTAASGLGNTGSGTGCSFVDYDNDGDQDLLVATGTSLLMYLNDGAGTFTEVSDMVGLSGGLGMGVACGDYDDDGDLDVFVSRSNYGDDLLFENQGNGNSWLNVELRGWMSERNGAGARVEAWVGTRVFARDVVNGAGLYSQNSVTCELGVGREAVIDSLIVNWPSHWRTRLLNVSSEQNLTISEGGYHKAPVVWE